MTAQTMAPTAGAALTEQNGWPAQGQWRYDDYLRLPNDGNRYEIIEGVLYVANAPSYEHQFTVGETAFHLRLFVKEHRLGVILEAPFEVHLRDKTSPVQPDILYITTERQPAPGTQFFAGAPDLIVEVISPGSIRLDRHIKFDAYERAGVPEYWLVDPKPPLGEIYILSNGGYALLGQHTNEERAESRLLAGVSIIASSLFLPQAN